MHDTPEPKPATEQPAGKAAEKAADSKAALSPAMRQYQQFKAQYPGYVLFFRMGDFYELFWEDAKLAARVLGVTLTSRSRGGLSSDDAIPMAGVPFHSVDGYLRRMIAAGHKVAICEQTEDASQAKGLVKRDVTRLMTPGTLTDDAMLDGRDANYLAAVAFGLTRAGGYRAGLAWVDLSTGDCSAMSGTQQQVIDELTRLGASEVLVPETASGQPHEIARLITKGVTPRPGWHFQTHHAGETIARQWGVRSAAGFGFDDDDPAVCAAAAVITYLGETQKTAVAHLRPLRRHRVEDHLAIDPASWRSLEIDRTIRSGSTEGSLLSAIDRTRSAMGARMLRQWLRFPLTDIEHIQARQSAIAALIESPTTLKSAAGAMDELCDIERVIGRIAVGRAMPRDMAALAKCLASIPRLVEILKALPRHQDVTPELAALLPFAQAQGAFLLSAVRPDPAPHLREGGVIADGFDAELDRLRTLTTDSQKWLMQYQSRLASETGIATLKCAYNKVFGYYIEVTDTHREKVPAGWTRKQTVRNAERYITEELKRFEDEATTAQERSIALEQQLFERVRQAILPHMSTFQELAGALARVDVLSSLATLAQERRYCRPAVDAGRSLTIVEGRHPVLDQQLGSDFVANDVGFAETDSLQLITGPNMAGKSTYIRQAALIVLLAQIGSYVPARSATVGVVDRLFTRIGASDELHSGQSTFMVEMVETANLLNNATPSSLIILDEIGRGTSTLDGLSLAWAIAEHIAESVRARTLFATHYHELTDLASRFKGVKNLYVAVREWEDQVVFLHRIVEGATDRSYGIHVARIAGIPRPVIDRARQLLGELSVQHVAKPRLSRRRGAMSRDDDPDQLPLFADPRDELMQALSGLSVEGLSPMQAFELLRDWKQRFARR